MPIQIPRREPTATPPGAQTRTRAGTPPGAQVDPQARFRRAKAHCGSCGEAWFGEVAFCPYCGRPSASAPVGAASTPPLVAEPDVLDTSPHPLPAYVRSRAAETRVPARQRDMDWKRWAQPIGLATIAAVFVFAAGQLAVTATRRTAPNDAVSAPPGDAERSGTAGTSADVGAPTPTAATPAIPRAIVEPPPQVAAPAPAQVTKPAPQAKVAVPTPPAKAAEPAPPAQAAAPAPAAPAATAKAAEPAPPAQAAEPAPPARNRALCSPASEAAGLCSAQ